ncbi:hypothetical protein GC722_03435 [Auraticoccus sp. F435]|uniref:Uncharacterized protein n=1 Tax=Auraticoccus cholistanensis TaxID=2656650 RepID=A0A6A9UU22_9ACTN|nr:hypothetical protein [Auraticoccus cholistanensis]MVA75084.1 hypothetical protein [Auraticoccus cholistanensis]
MPTNTVSRALHDVGLSAWFGGTLANAVGLNKAAGAADSARAAGKVANVGWDAWTPVNALAIGAHLLGSVGQLAGNKERIAAQQGVGTMSVVKTLLTAAALGVTAYSRVLGKKVSSAEAPPAESGTEPSVGTPPDVAAAMRKLKLLQWAVPVLTGSLLVLSSYAGEQQRAQVQAGGLLKRLMPGD